MGIQAIIGGSIGELFKKIVGSFKLDPETKAKVELALAENEFELRKIDAELASKLADYASQNIRAEASSDSWLAKNARPFFIFGGGLTILANIWIPLISKFTLYPIAPLELSEWFYSIYGAGFLGYAYTRMMEKNTKLGVH